MFSAKEVTILEILWDGDIYPHIWGRGSLKKLQGNTSEIEDRCSRWSITCSSIQPGIYSEGSGVHAVVPGNLHKVYLIFSSTDPCLADNLHSLVKVLHLFQEKFNTCDKYWRIGRHDWKACLLPAYLHFSSLPFQNLNCMVVRGKV